MRAQLLERRFLLSTTSSSSPLLTFSGRLAQTMRKYPLVSFFVLAYAVSWGLWLPVLLFQLPTSNDTTHTPAIFILPGIVLGVTGVAFLMTAVTQGKAGVLRLLHRYIMWRANWVWYTVAILGIPLTEILIGFVVPGGQDALHAFYPAALLLYPAAYFSHFYFGPLFEEAGWRGFALPRLQHQRGPFMGTLILGFLWGLWHLPVYLQADFQQGFISGVQIFGTFVLLTMAMAFIFTWVFNNTKGSLLFCILLHGSIDGTVTFIQVLVDRNLLSVAAAVNILQIGFPLAVVGWAVLLIVFTRGRLGYRHYQHEAETLDLAPSREGRIEPASPVR